MTATSRELGMVFMAGADFSSQTLPTPTTPHRTAVSVNLFMVEGVKKID